MSKRLLIVRNRNSNLLRQIDLDRAEQKIVLIQDGVYSEELREKGALLLKQDADARKIETDKVIDFDALLDEIIDAEKVISI